MQLAVLLSGFAGEVQHAVDLVFVHADQLLFLFGEGSAAGDFLPELPINKLLILLILLHSLLKRPRILCKPLQLLLRILQPASNPGNLPPHILPVPLHLPHPVLIALLQFGLELPEPSLEMLIPLFEGVTVEVHLLVVLDELVVLHLELF